MKRRLEERAARAGLDDLPRIHHAHPVRHACNHAEIVRNQQHAHPLPALDVGQQVEHLGLDGDVERRRRLVGDQQLRTPGQRHRDHDALLHASGELERVVRQPPRRIGNAHRLEQAGGFVARGIATQAMALERLGDLCADRHHRIEAGRRLLEDHPDPPTAHPAHRRLGQGEQVVPVQRHAATGDAAGVRQQARERKRGHRFAAARLAEQGEGFPGVDAEIDPIDRADLVLGARNRHAQSGDLQQRRVVGGNTRFQVRRIHSRDRQGGDEKGPLARPLDGISGGDRRGHARDRG